MIELTTMAAGILILVMFFKFDCSRLELIIHLYLTKFGVYYKPSKAIIFACVVSAWLFLFVFVLKR